MAKVKLIVKAEKVKFSAGRIAGFKCPAGKTQAFLWCDDPLGLAVKSTPAGSKSFIYQAKVKGISMRYKIGDVNVWTIPAAQAEARRLQTIIDQGFDPRVVKSDKVAAKDAEVAAMKLKEKRETVTVGTAWTEYITSRKPFWSALHLRDNLQVMQAGGTKRKRSKKLTEQGALASLAGVRLVDLTPEAVTEWAKNEVEIRPTRARLAFRLLRAFLSWCGRQPSYKLIVTNNAAKNADAREVLGKPKGKNDVLQREQLPAWFSAVKKISNPIVSAYLQTLLLIGSRREELAALRWKDVDFQWNSLTLNDKVEEFRIVPLTPYVAHLLSSLPRSNEWVFCSTTSESGHITDPSIAHRKACAIAGLNLSLHGLRRSFATLSEWIEMPAGIAAQIQGHAPQGVREQNYIRRPLDLLRKWHIHIESWLLEEAGVHFVPIKQGLQLVKSQ